MSSTVAVERAVSAMRAGVDGLVGVPVDALGPDALQAGVRAVARERDRLEGWLSAASGRLAACSGGRVPTPDGGGRSVAGWLAEATRTSPGAAGSALRTSAALAELPLVARAVLDGVLSHEQAAVLARLVGRIDTAHLREAESALISVAAGRDPGALGQYMRHLIATHCEPALDLDERAAADRRFLQTRTDDGMLRGRFALPAADAEVLLSALEPLARRDGQTDGECQRLCVSA